MRIEEWLKNELNLRVPQVGEQSRREQRETKPKIA